MTRAFILSLLCLCQLYLPQVYAQEQAAAKDTVYFTANRKSISMPFDFVHNLIVIPVRINNSPPLNFILDSGVKTTLITKLFYDDSLSLNQTDTVAIRGLGQGYTIRALHSSGNQMFMDGIKGDNHAVYVLLEDVLDLSMRMGMPIHGIIGYDIFKNFVVRVDYNAKMLTLYRPDKKVKIKRKAEVYPLEIEDSKAYVYANLKQFNGDSIRVRLIVDTGASNSMSLYLPSDKRLELPPKVMDAYLGRGLGGDINGKIGRVNSVSLGKYKLHDLPASFPDEEAIKIALQLSNRNGNLGSDILKRFTVIFDYPHQRLILQPNRKYKEPFHYNLAGFEITTPLPGTNIYVISHVVKDSPAMQVGIKPGDQLIYINGKSCLELPLPELLELLSSKPGRKLRMKMKRQAETFNVDLVLQSRI